MEYIPRLLLKEISPHPLNMKPQMLLFSTLHFLVFLQCAVRSCSFTTLAYKKRLPMSSITSLKCSVTYGENNFGDIMGGCETSVSVAGSFTPMERVVLSANGNLQRIMSAYYGAPVTVQVLKCDPIGPMAFHREVNLIMNGNVFCKAIGNIELYSDDCKKAIEERNVGVGQLFRFLGVLPSFKLLSAGRDEEGSLFREYELSCPQIRCRFVETFALGFLDCNTEIEAYGTISTPHTEAAVAKTTLEI